MYVCLCLAFDARCVCVSVQHNMPANEWMNEWSWVKEENMKKRKQKLVVDEMKKREEKTSESEETYSRVVEKT